MSSGALVDRVRQVWIDLAGVPVSFPADGVAAVVSPGSRLCPPGWAGLVVVGGAAIATVPLAGLVPLVSRVAVEDVTDLERLRTTLPVLDALGPAALAYLDAADFRPVPAPAERLPSDQGDLAALLASVDPADAEECGLDEITSAVFAVRGPAGLVAAAGYRRWPGAVAHLSVLTAPGHRGQGLARTVASAAVADARQHGLLPQWRARVAASRRVALALGFTEVGAQLSVRLEVPTT